MTRNNHITVWNALEPLMSVPEDGLPNHTYSNHTDRVVERWRNTPAGKDVYGYGHQFRLDPTRPSLTVTASNRHFHPHEPRCLTIREVATLSSFPLDYEFIGSMSSSNRQVGNAVPPHLAEAMFDAFRQP